eukprot:1899779-Rhodomonas_salina.1
MATRRTCAEIAYYHDQQPDFCLPGSMSWCHKCSESKHDDSAMRRSTGYVPKVAGAKGGRCYPGRRLYG